MNRLSNLSNRELHEAQFQTRIAYIQALGEAHDVAGLLKVLDDLEEEKKRVIELLQQQGKKIDQYPKEKSI